MIGIKKNGWPKKVGRKNDDKKTKGRVENVKTQLHISTMADEYTIRGMLLFTFFYFFILRFLSISFILAQNK